jgi:hypothetical protein
LPPAKDEFTFDIETMNKRLTFENLIIGKFEIFIPQNLGCRF